MLKKPLLRGLVIVRGDHECGIGAFLSGPARESQGFGCAVGSRAGHDFDAPGHRLHGFRYDALVLAVRKRR